MKVSANTFNAMPAELQALFSKCPNPGSDEVMGLFPVTKGGKSRQGHPGGSTFGGGEMGEDVVGTWYGDSGSAARFFYQAKAGRSERFSYLTCNCKTVKLCAWVKQDRNQNDKTDETGNGTSRVVFAGECFQSLPSTFICPAKDGLFTGVVVGVTSPLLSGISVCEGCGSEVRKTSHPTQKPETLMRYLCRLVTPPGGTVLDPFMGSGSTGKAAVLEGFNFIGIELEEKWFNIAEKRIKEYE